MAHHDAVRPAHAHPDDEYLQTPPGATYEHTDASVWVIVKFLIWLAVSAVIIHVGLGLLYALLIQRAMETGEQPYPLAAAPGERLPPAPRLQQFPANDLYQFRLGEESLLQGYGWMNKEAEIVHIPIEEAMRLMVERGLQSRAPAAGVAVPGTTRPGDAAAGRTVEPGR